MKNIWYLSPSNQGANLGVNDYGSERDQMYALALEITPHLDRAGVSFVIPERNVSIAERVRHSNDLEAGFHLALHSNAGGRGKAHGPVALYYSEAGKEFCQSLVDSLLALGQQTNRSYHVKQEKSLYELRKTTAPAALLEVDFHDSPVGVEFITTRRADIAEAIAKVIIEADGKQFVPVHNKQWDTAMELGLVPESAQPTHLLTWGDAAGALLRAMTILKGDVNG
jgi:N-acetylmuramoyl-L-alanine amidase